MNGDTKQLALKEVEVTMILQMLGALQVRVDQAAAVLQLIEKIKEQARD